MEATATENHPQQQISLSDHHPTNSQITNHDDLLTELHSLRQSYDALQSKSSMIEEDLILVKQERDVAINSNTDLKDHHLILIKQR